MYKFDWKFWEDNSMLKFSKDGKKVAILKDTADEPEGFHYKPGNELEDDIEIPEDVKSLEELDAEEAQEKN